MEKEVVNWLVGFISAIMVMLLTELYREKRRDKREKLSIFKQTKFFLNHYRDRFHILRDHLDEKSVRDDWKGLGLI